MNFLQQNCRFGFYTQGRASLCKSFKCGDKDLDDFRTTASRKFQVPVRKKSRKIFPAKRYTAAIQLSWSADSELARTFKASIWEAMFWVFIKAWFVDPLNKTGCRFLLVDSYNKERNLKFYQNNEFKFLFSTEEQEREFRGLNPDTQLNSRLMYFDLIELKKKQTGKPE